MSCRFTEEFWQTVTKVFQIFAKSLFFFNYLVPHLHFPHKVMCRFDCGPDSKEPALRCRYSNGCWVICGVLGSQGSSVRPLVNWAVQKSSSS